MVAETNNLKKMAEAELWQELYEVANAAGEAAATTTKPRVMVVQRRADPFDDNSEIEQEWVVPEGPCGFAWVILKPATHKFVRWLSKKGLSRSAYGGGHQIWVSGYNQSMDRKFAYADAFTQVLREAFDGEKLNIYSQSRMD